MHSTSRRSFLGVCALAVVAVANGCGSEVTPQSAVAVARSVGRVTGTDAYIAVVATASGAIVYVCDGTERTVTTSVWFDGGVTAGAFDLRAGTSRVSGRVSSTDITGTFTGTDGVGHAFTAMTATDTAGLYRDDRTVPGTLCGWILLPDGTDRGAAIRPSGQLATTTRPIVSPRDPASIVSPRSLAASVDGVMFMGIMVIAVLRE
jgi:hypothetical protein